MMDILSVVDDLNNFGEFYRRYRDIVDWGSFDA